MRAVVLALGIATVTFAGTTVYLARELSELKARSAAPAATPLTTGRASAAPSAAASAAPAESAGPASAPPRRGANAQGIVISNVSAATSLSDADIRRLQAEHSRQFLARLEEPQGREEMRAEHRIMFRNMYPGLDKYLGLTPDEHARFMNLMADQQIGAQEKHARCMLDPDCSLQSAWSGQDHAREINDFLGADRTEKFESYKNTMGEREAVAQLRTRLADNSRLSAEAAESLVAALAEERSAMHREAAASGNGMFSFGTGTGTVFAPAEGTFESRYEAAQRNSQRLRDRAAQHLDAEQMRTFNEMQDELLVSLRGQLRQKNAGFSAVTIARPSGVTTTEAVFVGETAERPD